MIWHGAAEEATASRQNQRQHFSYLQTPALDEKVLSELAVGVKKSHIDFFRVRASVIDQTIVQPMGRHFFANSPPAALLCF